MAIGLVFSVFLLAACANNNPSSNGSSKSSNSSKTTRVGSASKQNSRNNIHPALATNIPNFSKYRTVLIGYPTWWSRPSMIIHTLFDKYDFRDKTVIPFTTSMSTPMSASMPYIRQMAQPYNATVLNGYRYTGDNAGLRS